MFAYSVAGMACEKLRTELFIAFFTSLYKCQWELSCRQSLRSWLAVSVASLALTWVSWLLFFKINALLAWSQFLLTDVDFGGLVLCYKDGVNSALWQFGMMFITKSCSERFHVQQLIVYWCSLTNIWGLHKCCRLHTATFMRYNHRKLDSIH